MRPTELPETFKLPPGWTREYTVIHLAFELLDDEHLDGREVRFMTKTSKHAVDIEVRGVLTGVTNYYDGALPSDEGITVFIRALGKTEDEAHSERFRIHYRTPVTVTIRSDRP